MAGHREFKVAVTKDNLVFASAHFITFPGNRCEKLHGNTYRTRVVVEGGLDPEAHYVLDFSMLKALTRGSSTRSTTRCCCRSRARKSRSARRARPYASPWRGGRA